MSLLKILIVDDDEKARKHMESHIKSGQAQSLQVFLASNVMEAKEKIENSFFDVIVTDLNMDANQEAGMEVLQIAKKKNPSIRVIIITAFGNGPNGWSSRDQGAFAYVEKLANDSYSILSLKVAEALRFDVFISYNSLDSKSAINIAKVLERRGIRPWIDVERILPGQQFEDIIKEDIDKCQSVAVLIGLEGIGPKQHEEIDIVWGANKSIPVIPVLLPGVAKFPNNVGKLEKYSCIQLNECISNECVIEKFIRGIRGKPLSIMDYYGA